jgi:hypothetical protein
LEYGQTSSSYILHANILSPQLRWIIYLIRFNVCPRANALNEARVIDVYCTHKMMHFDPIPLAPILIFSMCEVVAYCHSSKALVLPLVIMRVLRHFGVYFFGEVVITTKPNDVVFEKILYNMSYQYDKDEQKWLLPKDAEERKNSHLLPTTEPSHDPDPNLTRPMDTAHYGIVIMFLLA